MTRLPRNYSAEYARRIERALARGLSRSQARGHAKTGEPTLRPGKVAIDNAYLSTAVTALNRNGTLAGAARETRISPERLRRLLQDHNLASRQGRRWQITDSRLRQMTAVVDGRSVRQHFDTFEATSLLGQHHNAIRRFLESNDPDHLRPFIGRSVTDASGVAHTLETDPNTLYRLAHAGNDVFEQIYRFVQ